jgi:hypothetical protein
MVFARELPRVCRLFKPQYLSGKQLVELIRPPSISYVTAIREG